MSITLGLCIVTHYQLQYDIWSLQFHYDGNKNKTIMMDLVPQMLEPPTALQSWCSATMFWSYKSSLRLGRDSSLSNFSKVRLIGASVNKPYPSELNCDFSYIYLAYVILYICKAACDGSEWHLAMQAWLTADSVMKLSESHLAMWVWHTGDSEILVEAHASNNIF